MKRLFRGGSVVSGSEIKQADVLTDGETILEVGENLEDGEAEIVDVAGKYLFPGFIDAHTHMDLDVSGTVTIDGFDTGTRAELAGGTTCIIDFATQNKGESLAYALSHWHEKADGKLVHRELSYRFFIGNTCGCTKHVPFDTESFRNRIFWKNLQEHDAKSKLDSMHHLRP